MNFCVDCEHHLMGAHSHFCRLFADPVKPDPVTGRISGRAIGVGMSADTDNLLKYPYRLCREINQGHCQHFTPITTEAK